MSVYKSRETWRNALLWWIRQRALDLATWAGNQVEYENIDDPDATKRYRTRYSFYDAKTGKETPVSP